MAALTPDQTNRAWEKMAEAEVRSLYFGDLAAHFTARKQWIQATAFVCSSGAAVTALSSVSPVLPAALAVVVAVLTGYSIAVNLDRRALAMAKLHAEWNQLANDYERLWRHWYEDDAEAVFEELISRASAVSERSTEAPYDQGRVERWEAFVYSRYEPKAA